MGSMRRLSVRRRTRIVRYECCPLEGQLLESQVPYGGYIPALACATELSLRMPATFADDCRHEVASL